MANKKDTGISKLISLVLRHKPEVLGLNLDEYGWCNVELLIKGINSKGYKVEIGDIERIVQDDEKQRYIFSEDLSSIRANQGHSIKVDLDLKQAIPPQVLFHGTSTRVLESILKTGIKKQGRQYVHLSNNKETATKVGARHGEVVVLEINSKLMVEEGIKFYLSQNGVWLTDFVDNRYILNR